MQVAAGPPQQQVHRRDRFPIASTRCPLKGRSALPALCISDGAVTTHDSMSSPLRACKWNDHHAADASCVSVSQDLRCAVGCLDGRLQSVEQGAYATAGVGGGGSPKGARSRKIQRLTTALHLDGCQLLVAVLTRDALGLVWCLIVYRCMTKEEL